MIYFKRFFWLIGLIVVNTISIILFMIFILLLPITASFYYIKKGTVENMEFNPSTIPQYILDLYGKLEP